MENGKTDAQRNGATRSWAKLGFERARPSAKASALPCAACLGGRRGGRELGTQRSAEGARAQRPRPGSWVQCPHACEVFVALRSWVTTSPIPGTAQITRRTRKTGTAGPGHLNPAQAKQPASRTRRSGREGAHRVWPCAHRRPAAAPRLLPQPPPSSVPRGPDPSPQRHLKHEPLTLEPKQVPTLDG